MDTIRFDRHPATVTLGNGENMAARYLVATWALWIGPVVALAIASVVVSALAANTAFYSGFDSGFRYLPRSEQFREVADFVVPFLGAGLVLAVTGLVISWYYTAIAIRGLRGRPITAAWVLGAGLRSLAGSILIGLVGLACWAAFAVLVLVTGGIALLGLLVLIPAAVYVAIRLFFWNLAVFDGAGILEAFRASWEFSTGAVLRMLGWGIAFALVQLVVSVAAGMAQLPFFAVPAVGVFLNSLITGIYAVFMLFGGAVLYESQRWIKMPPANGQPGYGYPGYPSGGYPAPGGYPGYGAYPGYLAPGAYPAYPGQPAYPAAPGHPPQGTPAYPTQSAYPGQSAYPPSAADSSAPPAAPSTPPSTAAPPPAPGAIQPVPAAPGTPPPLVPWGPVPQQPAWSPGPSSWQPAPSAGWTPAPQTGWSPVTPSPTPPAPTPPPDAGSSTSAPPPADAASTPDESPTEPSTPPPS